MIYNNTDRAKKPLSGPMIMNTQKNELMWKAFNHIAWVAVMIVLLSCGAGKNTDLKPPESRRIVDITINESADALEFTISADQPLNYTVEKQTAPLGVVLRFGDTGMDIFERVYFPPENEFIRSVTADAVIEDNVATSYIFIELKKDTPYEVTTTGRALLVAFPKALAASKASEEKKDAVDKNPKVPAAHMSVAASAPVGVAAARLKKITVTPQKDNLVVKVEADGTIKNYKRFSMRNPARIVIDMYGLESPHSREKIIAVESTWLKQARYYGHPDKVRLVLETYPRYLYQYSVQSIDSGLSIRIGGQGTDSIGAISGKARSEIVLGLKPGERHITLKWDDAPNATSYNLYWRTSPGVTKRNGKKIANIANPVKISGLNAGTTYYFVVTTIAGSRESVVSKEMSFAVEN
jgi:hypothetical protein